MTSGFATVKGVTSGDTLLLVGRAAAGPPPELQLTLSGVAAPRLAKGSNAVDEPFAWAARDFLRRLALGKAVSFRVDGEAAFRRPTRALDARSATTSPTDKVTQHAYETMYGLFLMPLRHARHVSGGALVEGRDTLEVGLLGELEGGKRCGAGADTDHEALLHREFI